MSARNQTDSDLAANFPGVDLSAKAPFTTVGGQSLTWGQALPALLRAGQQFAAQAHSAYGDVENSPGYKAMPTGLRAAIRAGYFKNFIARALIDPKAQAAARSRFSFDYGQMADDDGASPLGIEQFITGAGGQQ